ncbi:hypothetical protein [Georgenia yuyongxinii]|uniref:Uncharacterized protein n=1 Tax=Georgenia yuyongxinii TaxID=2589797 RepID=A0A552WUP6_9MICO|nr:hypothetical protein [Georgenia yuyongxinii]TRW46426.1 hypothetical protein FJ693_05730 [Georgenia yuyongxinii]
MTATLTESELLPGQDAALQRGRGETGVTERQVLRVARRLDREAREHGRPRIHLEVSDGLPGRDVNLVMASWRVPPRDLLFARARAEVEGSSLSAILRAFLAEFATTPPGSTVRLELPGRRSVEAL